MLWFDRLDQGSWCIHSDLPLLCSVMVEYTMENGTMPRSPLQVRICLAQRQVTLMYMSKVLIYAVLYDVFIYILLFTRSNGGCNLCRKPSDTEVG